MTQLEFKNPLLLLLLVPYVLMAGWYFYARVYRRDSAVALSSERVLNLRRSFRVATYRFLPAFRFAAILLLLVAVARPGKGIHYSSVKNLGIDIMIALDVSGSMMGEDFQPKNRLEVAKQVVADFIGRRSSDRVGMAVFAGEAYLQCPLTVEHDMLTDIVSEIDFTTVGTDGTAIGDAIALSAARMSDDKAKSRIILLLTDGMNNRGAIDPETAANACKDMGVKIYCVGIGKEGKVPYPGQGGLFFGKRYMMNHFDETLLREISEKTGGRFYRAQSSGVLWENISDIDRLEKSEVEVKVYHEFHDRFQYLLAAAMALFFIEILLRSVVYRKIP
ncbi:MAG TPA: VWA domain-containing protein [Spirochaetota bacterium]|nr:VWA domain-containing protein [Spirochaetota bacterium]HPI90558.1 VWA domain-containing protein [Spirochaetota bacterium]HPR49250.1 VWA domain-containing protein [Spirochaetota bacterium]